MKSVAAVALYTALASASPLLEKRGRFCDQWGAETAGPYTVYNNLWGAADAESGQQCTTNNGLIGGSDSISWSTEWTWVGGPYNVKSYANVVVENDYPTLGSVSSMPTEWSWM